MGQGLESDFAVILNEPVSLFHLIDASVIDLNDPLYPLHTINRELVLFNKNLMEKPQVIVLNKIDIPGAMEAAKKFQQVAKEKKVILISALTGEGIDDLKRQIRILLDRFHE
jgi:GTP-binding protein